MPNSQKFLDLKNYRLKRLVDAGKILPLLGAFALLFPLPFFFIQKDGQHGAAALALYMFLVWLVLIIAARLLMRPLQIRAGED